MLFIPFPDNGFIILSQIHTHKNFFLTITVIIYEKSNLYGKFMRK